MMTRFDVPLGAIIRIPFASYNSAGASVTMTGFAITDVRVYKDGNLTERDESGYTATTDFDALTGLHILEIDTSEDDSPAGFWAVGSEYHVAVASVTIDSQTVNLWAAWFRIVAAEAIAGKPKVDVDAWIGTAAATPTVAGVPEVDVTHWLGTAAATPTVAGVPEVDVTHVAGTAAQAASGRFQVDVELVEGADATDALASAVQTTVGPVASGTADSGTTTTMVDAARTEADTDYWKGNVIEFTSGNISGQARLITGFTPGTDTITFTPALTQSVGTQTYRIWPAGRIDTAELAAAVADAVLDEDMTGHQTQGTLGQAIGDPGADTDTIFGLVNTNLNATVSSRASQTSVDTVDDLLDTEIAAILAAVDTEVAAIKAKTDNLPASPASVSDVTSLLTTQLTEGYAADGTAPTLSQALMLIQQMLGEFSISGTTLTVKRLNGSTTAATFTLDSATAPTSITRAS